MPYSSKLHIPLSDHLLLAAQQEPYKNKTKKDEKFAKNKTNKKARERNISTQKNDTTERARGLCKNISEEFGESNDKFHPEGRPGDT